MTRVQVHITLAILASVVAAPGAVARGAGYSVATIAIPADGASTAAAVQVARIADEAFAVDDDVEVLDLEKILERGDPPWVAKRASADAARVKGSDALAALELSVAADALAQALVAYEQAVPGLKDMTPVVETLMLAGQVFALQGDVRTARTQFGRALALDPAYRLPREDTPARVLKVLDAVIKERRSAGLGSLTVYATCGAAEVWVDGVFRGVSPLSLEFEAGRHYVRVVRDGYVAWGTAADVKRGSETSVQAQVRPTADLARVEELSLRVARSKDGASPVADLAAALRVDRLLALVVEDANGSALVTGSLVDGVSGRQLARATRAFAPADAFFERDVRNFVLERLSRPSTEVPAGEGVEPVVDPARGSLLPGRAEAIETPGAVIGGWVLVGMGAALAVNTTVFGILSYDNYDKFRNRLPSQRDPALEPLRGAWLTTSLITDASWLLGAAALGGGTALLLQGYAELEARQEILNP